MADRAISDLTIATQIKTDDLFLIQQDNTAKSVKGETFSQFIQDVEGITNIEQLSNSGNNARIKITYRGGRTVICNIPYATQPVESVNSKSGVVVLTGSDIKVSSSDSTKIDDKIGQLNTSITTLNTSYTTLNGKFNTLDGNVSSLSDSVGGLNTQVTSLNNAVSQFNSGLSKTEILVLSTSAEINSLSYTFSDPNIETDMVCLKMELSNPDAQKSNWTINTNTAQKAIVTGDISGSTKITIYLAKTR